MTIKIKDLRELIKDLPDDMPVVLVDLNDDREDMEGVYVLTDGSLGVEKGVLNLTGNPVDVFVISFANTLQ